MARGGAPLKFNVTHNSLGVEIAKDPLRDFRKFLFLVWKHLDLPDPTPVQYDIAHYLQHGPRRKVIEAFRGVGKSWITSAYVCWLLYMDPQLNIMVVSASKERSDQFTTFTLQLIREMPLLAHLVPRSNQRESKINFDVAMAKADHAPSVRSVGIMGQMTGGRADIIIPDDVEVPNNSETQTSRDKLAERIKEFEAILKPAGDITYLGTPQTEESIYNKLPERGYEIRIWPARMPDAKKRKSYGSHLAPMIAHAMDVLKAAIGDPTDPKRFHNEDLLERELSYGRSSFALQYMLDTTLSDQDRYPLKVSDLVVMRMDPRQGFEKLVWANEPDKVLSEIPCVAFNGDRYYGPMRVSGEAKDYEASVMAIDPSGRGKDETSYAVAKTLNGWVYVPSAGGVPGGYSTPALEALAKVAKEQGVNRIIIESNFGDGMFTELFRPVLNRVYPCAIEEVRHSIQKEKRIIDTLEPVMNQHRLVVDPRVIEEDYRSTQHLPPESVLRYQLFYQMTRVTRERGALAQDDRLDALAMAVGYHTKAMARDADKHISRQRQQAVEQQIKDIQKAAKKGTDAVLFDLGTKPKRNRSSWCKL